MAHCVDSSTDGRVSASKSCSTNIAVGEHQTMRRLRTTFRTLLSASLFSDAACGACQAWCASHPKSWESKCSAALGNGGGFHESGFHGCTGCAECAIRASAVSSFMQLVCREPGVLAAEAAGLKGCLEEPRDQVAKCTAQLRDSRAWPSNETWAAALKQYSMQGQTVLFVGDSTMRNKHATLLAHGVPNVCHNRHRSGQGGVCHMSTLNGTCLSHAWPSIHFDAVVYNGGGLHLLHADQRSFKGYLDAITNCAQDIATRYPGAKLLYMLSNAICTDKWDGNFLEEIVRMRRSIQFEESAGYTLQWSDIGAMTLNVAEHVAMESGYFARRWSLIGTQTRSHCECTGYRDGRHFLPLIPSFLVRLSHKIWGLSVPIH